MSMHKLLRLVTAATFALILAGCATTAERTLGGAGLGAAAGAAIGSESANAGKGAAIGAGIGGLGGYLYDADQKEAERRDRYRDRRQPRRNTYYGPRG